MKSFKECVQEMQARCYAEWQQEDNVEIKAVISSCSAELKRLLALL